MAFRCWIMLFSSLLFSEVACGQFGQIHVEKLPQDERVRAAYSKVLPVESLARDWSPKWAHDTPKEQVVAILTASLKDLHSAETAAPDNPELFLLTGLVAHLAYNVDVAEAYQAAVDSLERAQKLAPDDYRTAWFLGLHHCQSDQIKVGMAQLLAVESQIPWQQLPVDFWNDYISCSTISMMPAHTLRAVDRAVHLGASPASYYSLVDTAQKRYKSTDSVTTYSAHETWQATHEGKVVHFTSQLCGMAFSAHENWHMDIGDVSKGTCLATTETGPYPSKTGQGVPTLLVMTRAAKPQETLEDFVLSFVKKYPTAHPITAPSCPSEKCVGYEIVTDTTYKPEGGGHFLVVGFAGQPPDFPGLLFEKPDEPPKSKPGDPVTYYHPIEKLHRLPGVLYSVVELDSNESIFEKASADFQDLLRSVQLD
jgi:hypothetical protein